MSHNDLLRIQNLKVCAGEKEILHGIDLDIHENEVHVLMGPNGTGKSTLGAALMGNPAYTVTGGASSIRDRISTKCRITNVPRTAFSCRSRTP
ncbi:MAG: ATP-binding cassette domain-containing protein [Ruminococcus callidus]